ncbi:MAG: hypothetical protein A2Z34_05455 [Planctomycetes bacterium RBG_16_59_8]|nr:MAG: hypothetical protein A2Z34_05455 [Planctomycetes bacterium RBG_16_59_8]
MRKAFLFFTAIALLPAGGCGDERRLRMATTTSVYDSGLLDALLPVFTAEEGIAVDVIVVGSGKALKLAERGDCDCVLTHSPKAEEDVVRKGVAAERGKLMSNFFMIVGPAADPAGLSSVANVRDAFARIAEKGTGFVSRGDDSGTHRAEMAVWLALKIDPRGKAWYLESGTGMGETLELVYQKNLYTLTDQGTYLAYRNSDRLTCFVENDPALLNVYSFLAVSASPHRREAERLGRWLRSPRGQELIGGFRKRGLRAFEPIADRKS